MKKSAKLTLYGALLLCALIAGSQFRILKILIKERGGSWTTYRVALPGRELNAVDFVTTNYMCHVYDLFGLRHRGGFGRVTDNAAEIAREDHLAMTPTEVIPDERDQQVLETLLLHLRDDPNFKMTRVPTNGGVIVLHARTPDKTGFIQANQIQSDIGNHSLSVETETNLRERNSDPKSTPGRFGAVTAHFTNLVFATGIIVADLPDLMRGDRSNPSFEELYPNGRGWLQAYLPGYSKSGERAVVRAYVGPSSHGGIVTAVLERAGSKWFVKWYHVALFA